MARIGESGEVVGGASSGFAIRRPPSAWDRLRSPLIVVAGRNGGCTWRVAGQVVARVLLRT